ncbi:hypothetical protein YC2023_052505 [Brassica napus]
MSALTQSNLTSSSFVAFLITPFNFAVQSFVYIFSNKFYTLLPFSKELHPFPTSLYHSYKEGCRVKAINSHSVSKATPDCSTREDEDVYATIDNLRLLSTQHPRLRDQKRNRLVKKLQVKHEKILNLSEWMAI